jgi:hypothetical protein
MNLVAGLERQHRGVVVDRRTARQGLVRRRRDGKLRPHGAAGLVEDADVVVLDVELRVAHPKFGRVEDPVRKVDRSVTIRIVAAQGRAS